MKIRTTLALVAMLMFVSSVFGQTVTIPLSYTYGPTGPRPAKRIRYFDGDNVQVSWKYENAPAGTIATVQVLVLANGQPAWGYPVSRNQRCLPTGSVTWIPRSIDGAQQCIIRVTWRTVLVGTVIATADSPSFTVVDLTDRYITLNQPTVDTVMINSKSLVNFTWTTSRIPAGAVLHIVAQPSWNSEAGGIVIADTADTGGYKWWVGDIADPTPGKYFVTIFYVTESGVVAKASNTLPIMLPDPSVVPTP